MALSWFAGFVMAAILTAVPLAQAQQGNIKLTTLAQVERAVFTEGGRKEIKRVPAEKVVSGTEVIFTTQYENISTRAVEHAVITNPMPDNMIYKEGSARGEGAAVTFSVDGGKTYQPAADLFVYDTAGRKYPSRPQDYTHIRWTFETVIPSGARGDVSFTAVLE
jgi:uncharacterized repeat protein (TIGR01451 family)